MLQKEPQFWGFCQFDCDWPEEKIGTVVVWKCKNFKWIVR
jgi:hypothetical protein